MIAWIILKDTTVCSNTAIAADASSQGPVFHLEPSDLKPLLLKECVQQGKRSISFHGPGTVFPSYRPNDFRVELSLVTAALSQMQVLEFTVPQFKAMFEENTELSEQVVNWYSMYINRFLFETVHQTYNSALTKLCNLLYLLTINQPANSGLVIDMTQDELAELLGMSRVQITRELSELRRRGIVETTRGKLLISDLPALASLCTQETV